MVIRLISLLFLCGCSAAPLWQLDDLTSNIDQFDSSRLRYANSDPISLEMVRVGNEISAFLSLTHSRLPQGPLSIAFATPSKNFEDKASVHEGRMRVRLSTAATNQLISALKSGEDVVISLDGQEQKVQPDRFQASFTRFLGEKSFYETLLNGAL